MYRFGIPPKIKFAASFRLPAHRNDGRDASAHYHQLLRQVGNIGIEADRLGDVGERPAGVNGYLMRILVDHANDEVRGVFVRRLNGGIPFLNIRDLEWAVKHSSLSVP